MALTDPRSRLRGPDGALLPRRRPCARCSGLISAYALALDRFCFACAPHEDDEPTLDRSLYCRKGHLRAAFEVEIVDRSRSSNVKRTCSECKRLRDQRRDRDRSAAGKAARELERRKQAARELERRKQAA